MRPAAPPASGAPLERSVAACLASILEVDAPASRCRGPGTRSRGRCGAAGCSSAGWGSSRSRSPRRSAGRGRGSRSCARARGRSRPSPSAPRPDWSGGRSTDRRRSRTSRPASSSPPPTWRCGYRSPAPPPREEGRRRGAVVAAGAEAACVRVDGANAEGGQGLGGATGTSRVRDVSNVHSAAMTSRSPGGGLDASGSAPEDARRNVVTRGIDLNALVGRRFRIGEVECVGRRFCEPCARSSGCRQEPFAAHHRGGLRAADP